MSEPKGEPKRRSRRKPSAREATPLWPPQPGTGLALAGVLPLFATHYFYAGLYNTTGFSLILAMGVILAVCLFRRDLRQDLMRLRGLEVPGALFAVVIALALLSLTPFAPGGPHPVWEFTGQGPGSTSIDTSSTSAEIIKLLGLSVIFLVGAITGSSDRRARIAIWLILGLGLALGLWAFFGSVTGTVYSTGGRRLEGHFLNPNTAGTFFACLLILTLAMLTREIRAAGAKEKLVRALPLSAIALTFAVCLLMTGSRGASLAFVGAAVTFITLQVFSKGFKLTRGLAIGFGLLLGGALLVYLVGDLLVERFFGTDRDAGVRTSIWAAHWKAFLAAPIMGYGLGTSESVNLTVMSASTFDYLMNIRGILNVYLQWLEQAGVLGAVPMFLCIGWLIIWTGGGAFSRTRMTLPLIGLLAVDAAFLLHGITDFALEAYSMSAFWAYLLGLQFALAQGTSSR